MRWARTPWLLLAGIWIVAGLLLVHFEVVLPGPDVVQFKGPGIYFAQHGLLGAINLPFSPPNVPAVYAFYPPLYPLLFGLWCKVAGVSLQASITFDLLIRTLRAVMIVACVWPMLRGRAADAAGRRGHWLVAITVVVLAFGPNNEDRPDDLGLVLGLASWLALRAGRLTLSGIALGLCGAVSPVGGVFAAIGTVLFCRARPRAIRSVLIVGGVAALVAGAAIAPVAIADASAIARFLQNTGDNAAPYHYAVSDRPWIERATVFVHQRSQYLVHGVGVLTLLVSLAALAAWSWRQVDDEVRAWARPFAATSLVFAPVAFVVFPKDPLYLWFASVGLVIAVLGLAQHHRRTSVVLVGIVLGMSVLLARQTKQWLDGVTRAPNQRLEAVQGRLLAQLPASARVAVWPDAYFTLVGVRATESLQFSCEWLGTYDYAFVSSGTTFPAAPLAAPALSAWCPVPAAACFTIQDDSRDTPPVPWIGRWLDLRTRGFGGVLYKRTGC